MANIEIQGAQKRYGNSTILHDISMDIRDGEFLVLVGPSGCGKSTLLRMIAGLEGFSSGSLLIGGRSVADLPPKDRDIAMVFQNYALYPHMTVARNMGFSLEIARVDRKTRDESVRSAAEALGLTPLLERYPRQLSGGQRQRVAMGRAIVRKPSVFLFDEPLSNLDAQLRVEMRAEIKRLHQKLSATIVYVTHDQVEAMTMADRIAVMNKGRLEQLGTPMELYDSPANTFVARFIGSPAMNMIPGRLSADGPGPVRFVSDDGESLALERFTHLDQRDREILLGVRSEDFAISSTGFSARVALVEPMGSETQILCMHGNTQITVTLREREPIRQGDVIKIEPRQGHIRCFDKKTDAVIAMN